MHYVNIIPSLLLETGQDGENKAERRHLVVFWNPLLLLKNLP